MSSPKHATTVFISEISGLKHGIKRQKRLPIGNFVHFIIGQQQATSF